MVGVIVNVAPACGFESLGGPRRRADMTFSDENHHSQDIASEIPTSAIELKARAAFESLGLDFDKCGIGSNSKRNSELRSRQLTRVQSAPPARSPARTQPPAPPVSAFNVRCLEEPRLPLSPLKQPKWPSTPPAVEQLESSKQLARPPSATMLLPQMRLPAASPLAQPERLMTSHRLGCSPLTAATPLIGISAPLIGATPHSDSTAWSPASEACPDLFTRAKAAFAEKQWLAAAELSVHCLAGKPPSADAETESLYRSSVQQLAYWARPEDAAPVMPRRMAASARRQKTRPVNNELLFSLPSAEEVRRTAGSRTQLTDPSCRGNSESSVRGAPWSEERPYSTETDPSVSALHVHTAPAGAGPPWG